MPRQKRRRERTGCVRRRPMRQVQEQYRHNHGLCTHDVTLRQCFQAEMAATSHASNLLCRNITDMLIYSTIVHTNPYQMNRMRQEIALMQAMHYNVLQPIENYYFQQESSVCDVPDNVHDTAHEYLVEQKRTIDELSDYQALHYTNFTKP